MLLKEKLWMQFVKNHGHLSLADLEDIQKIVDLSWDEGYGVGFEKSQEIAMKTADKIQSLFR